MDEQGVSPLPSKIQAVSKMTPPANVKDIQCFLGMLGYYQRLIPLFANVAQPLFNFLKKEINFLVYRVSGLFYPIKTAPHNCTSVALF